MARRRTKRRSQKKRNTRKQKGGLWAYFAQDPYPPGIPGTQGKIYSYIKSFYGHHLDFNDNEHVILIKNAMPKGTYIDFDIIYNNETYTIVHMDNKQMTATLHWFKQTNQSDLDNVKKSSNNIKEFEFYSPAVIDEEIKNTFAPVFTFHGMEKRGK